MINSHIVNQDFIAWVGQGALADRTREHLGESDRGVLLMRRKMFEQIQRVQEGTTRSGSSATPSSTIACTFRLLSRNPKAYRTGKNSAFLPASPNTCASRTSRPGNTVPAKRN
jgi:5,5'-dehydrodivanillate O-demethylase